MDAEIVAFWEGIVLAPVSRPVGLALRLALLTAARANEVAGAARLNSSLMVPNHSGSSLPRG